MPAADSPLDDYSGGSGRSASRYLDIRIHTPTPTIRVVRITGELDSQTIPLMIDRVSEQIVRAEHVVVDLGGVGFLEMSCLTALMNLHASAKARGVTLHWTGAHGLAVTRPLELLGLDRKARMHSVSADAVVARLRLEHLLNDMSRPDTKQSADPGVS